MNEPTIALPQDLATERARKAQRQQEINGVMLAMTCSLYERMVANSISDPDHAIANEGLPERLHSCAKLARMAAKVFAQEFLREVPAPNAAT
jgi:hypothetical protein